MRLMPEIHKDRLCEAFILCCEEWPYGAVTNLEINAAMRFLGISAFFQYEDVQKQDKLVEHYVTGVHILLIPEHYTVLRNGDVLDDYYKIQGHEEVLCRWTLVDRE